MVQLSATRCSSVGILWVSLVSFAAITLSVASQQVIPKVSVYLVTGSVRKLLRTPFYSWTLAEHVLLTGMQNYVHWATGCMIGGSSLGRSCEFLSSPPRPEGLRGPTQPLIQWVQGALSLGVKLTTHLHLVPRSRMRGVIHSLPQYAFIACCFMNTRSAW
jgi:hypothetical protein